jgi:monoterpene epsilon-lactone hydrolase
MAGVNLISAAIERLPSAASGGVMPSSEAQAVHKLNSDLREAWLADPNYTFDDFRRIFEDWLAQFAIPDGTRFSGEDCGGVPCIWVDAPGSTQDRVIVHFHSGGYLMGSASGYRSFGGFLAAATGCRVLLVDYRLAPEHPFPSAIQDALAVYTWLLGKNYDPGKMLISGDSAGGGLALITLQALRDEGLPLPAGGISISPLADQAHEVASRVINEGIDPLVTMALIQMIGSAYCGTLDPKLPRLSPLYGDWRGLPPLLIFAGEIELLRDDGKMCAAAAVRDGVDATYVEGEGMTHIWTLYADRLPEAREALDQIGAFARRHLADA